MMKHVYAFIIVFIMSCATASAIERVLSNNADFNRTTIDRNFQQIFYKKIEIAPTSATLIYEPVATDTNSVLVGMVNTSDSVYIQRIYQGYQSAEIQLSGAPSTTIEVSLFGIIK